MFRVANLAMAAVAVLLLVGVPASGQGAITAAFDFEDGTDQGFGNGFGNDASETFPIVDIGGSMRMEVLRDGGFQEAGREGTSNPFLGALNRAAANPGISTLSYDYYIDTSPGGFGSFLQLGTYFNSGSGAYSQSFVEFELDSVALASGNVFSGTVTQTFADKFSPIDPGHVGQTFQRIGLIVNGDGADATVYFDNVTITGIPEPASMALLGLALPALLVTRRRRRMA